MPCGAITLELSAPEIFQRPCRLPCRPAKGPFAFYFLKPKRDRRGDIQRGTQIEFGHARTLRGTNPQWPPVGRERTVLAAVTAYSTGVIMNEFSGSEARQRVSHMTAHLVPTRRIIQNNAIAGEPLCPICDIVEHPTRLQLLGPGLQVARHATTQAVMLTADWLRPQSSEKRMVCPASICRYPR